MRITSSQIGLWGAAAFVLAEAANAQLTRGYFSGTIQDPAGAVVESAGVTITNRATGVRTRTETSNAGIYRIAAVETGIYSIEFSKAGFDTRRIENVGLGTTQEVILNQTLAVASTATSVDVRESPPGAGLAKASAAIDLRLDGKLVEALPANGRDATSLVTLAPLVVIGQGGNTSSSGQRNFKNDYIVDGLSHNNPDIGALWSASRLIPEAVEEFQVQTAAYSAEYGRNTGAQVSAVTRRGTNQWHGSAWDYFSSDALEARNLPDERNGLAKRRLVTHEAGASLGGPVVKNRTFFFGLFENDTRRQGPSTRQATDISIPTEEGFASLSRVPLAAGQTAESRLAMLDALDFLRGVYPRIKSYQRIVTQNVNGTPLQIGTTRIPFVNTGDDGLWRGRFDHQLTSRDSLTFTTQGSLLRSPFAINNSNVGFAELFAESSRFFNQKHALSHTRAITARWINEVRFGATWLRTESKNQDDRPADVISQAFTIGRDPNAPFDINPEYNSYQWQNISTFAVQRHFLKAGVDINLIDRFENKQNNARGTWRFDNLAAFLNNQATSFARITGAQAFEARSVNQAYFVQDDIRVTKDFTLTLGLRYERWNVPLGYFGATLAEVLAIGVPPPTRPDRNNWAPRFGLAFSPGAKNGLIGKILGDGLTVFRGGYGVGYDSIVSQFVASGNYPRAASFTVNRPETTNLYPNIPPSRPGVLNPLATFQNVAPDAQLPTLHFYSFSIQRQLRRHYVLELGYAGNRAYHLEREGQPNYAVLTPAQAQTVIAARTANAIPGTQQRRLNPAWGLRSLAETTGLGYYNAGFVRLDRRFSNGLLFGANYTWSCAMADENSGVQSFASYRNENGRALNDRPHRAVVHYTYAPPWFHRAGLLPKYLLSGWQFSGFSQWQSGGPFNVTVGVDATGDGSAVGDRPLYNPQGLLVRDPVTRNLRTFSTPLDGTGIFVVPLDAGGRPLANSMPSGGNLGKQAFRGPSLALTNFSLAKTFPITERVRIDLRADSENLLNHRNFLQPVAILNNVNFGNNTSDPGTRILRLSVKLRF